MLFDDGVDLIEDPDALQGRWKDEWERELDDRIAQSDFVSTGAVKTIRVEVNPEGRESYHLTFEVDRNLKGNAPRGQISLSSRGGASGYASLDQYRERMLNRELVAFVRYAKEQSGAVVTHFHLAPPSEAIKRGIGRSEAGPHKKHIQVIEHHNK